VMLAALAATTTRFLARHTTRTRLPLPQALTVPFSFPSASAAATARNLAHAMRVVVVPMLEDNYAYLLIDDASKQAAVVDPVEPAKAVAAATEHHVKLVAVLTTHSHWDHDGGNPEMARLIPDIPIYGGQGDGAKAVTKELVQGDTVCVGGLEVRVLSTPCHTPGHVSYFVQEGADRALFTGDTLFVAGCGNFNSGTPQQMYNALIKQIGALPRDTKVYVGHEYTVSNLRFAQVVEPKNDAARKKLAWAQEQRKAGVPTVPSTLEDEFNTNPFMRIGEPSLAAYTGKADPVDILLEVRTRKTEWGRKK
jgi:hydroxyacylglutathione hydrolase